MKVYLFTKGIDILKNNQKTLCSAQGRIKGLRGPQGPSFISLL